MHIGSRHAPLPEHRFRPAPAVGAMATGNRFKFGAGQRMMIGMPTQGAFRQVHRLQRQGRQAFLHLRITRQQTQQFGAHAFDIGQ